MKTTLSLLAVSVLALAAAISAMTQADTTARELHQLRLTNEAFAAEAKTNFGELYMNDFRLVTVLTNHISAVHPVPAGTNVEWGVKITKGEVGLREDGTLTWRAKP